MQTSGRVFNIERHALHDGPGIRTLIFLSGCPLACKWCANPEGLLPACLYVWEKQCTNCGNCVSACKMQAISMIDGKCVTDRNRCQTCGACTLACPQGAREISGKTMTTSEVLAIAERDRVFYQHSGGGITLSGGEPFYQPEFARSILMGAKKAGLNTAVETCGAVKWSKMQMSLDYVDYLLFDIKHVDDQKHFAFTGASNRVSLDNVRRAGETGIDIIARVPIIPTFNDTIEEAERIVQFIASIQGVSRIDLLPFHKLAESKHNALGTKYPMSDADPLEYGLMNLIAKTFRKIFPETYIEA